jgi:Predicted acyl-CoA transferases/carnitine dehydratase
MTLIHRQDIRQELIDLFLTKTRNEWIEFFQDTEVCFSPVLEFEETLNNPHFVAKESYESTDDGKHIIGFNLGIRQIG